MKDIKIIFVCAVFLVTLSYLVAQTTNNPATNPRDNPDALRPTQMAQPRTNPNGGSGPLGTPTSAVTPVTGINATGPSPAATIAPSATPSSLNPVFTATPH